MNDNQFDEFFRKKLEDYPSQVPGDMWRRIKQKKDKDRRVIIFLVLFLLMAGGATSYLIFGVKQAPDKESITSSRKQDNNNIGNISPNKNQKHETITTQKDTLNFSNQNKISLANNDIDKKNRAALNKKDYKSFKTNKFILNDLEKEEKNREEKKEEKNNPDKKKSLQQNFGENNRIDSSKNNLQNLIAIKPNRDISVKQIDKTGSLMQNDSSQKKEQKVASSAKQKNIQSSIINNFFLEVYASPDVPVSKTSSNNVAYLRHKDSTSKMQLSYTLGVRAGISFGDHFTVKTGFQYSDINEKFNYTNKSATRTVPVVITRNLVDAYGATQTVLDTSNLIQVGKEYKLTYNHFKSIDIPVLIGYQTNGDRLKVSFNTGIILNVKTNYKGDILDASLNPADINSNNFYKSNTGVSLYFGLGVATRLNNGFQLFTEPYIKYRLTNMTGTYQPFTQKINVGGLSLGLRYNFKN